MKSIMAAAALVFLCAACGPTPPPADARDFEPAALPPSGPQPWQKGTPKPTATQTPRPAAPAAAPTPAVQPTLTPAELEAKVLALMREGVDKDLILAYVNRQTLSGKLTVDDILEWKRAGISDEVIKAAASR